MISLFLTSLLVCVWIISYHYWMFAFTIELLYFIIFFFLVVALSFPPREVSLAFGINWFGGDESLLLLLAYKV